MNTYSILMHNKGTIEIIKKGWSWPAFFLGGFWAFFKAPLLWGMMKGFWFIVKPFFSWFSTNIQLSHFNEDTNVIISVAIVWISINIIYGICGNSFREQHLLSTGFSFITWIEAPSEEEALRLYEKRCIQQKQEQEAISGNDEEDISTSNLEEHEDQGQDTFFEDNDISISSKREMDEQVSLSTDRHNELHNSELAPKFIPGNDIPMDSLSRTIMTILGSIFGICAGFFIFAGMAAIYENIGATVGLVLLGVIIGIVAYRLITDYGAKPEGGMLSCTAYAILGGIFVALAIWGSVTLITKGKRWDDALWGVSWLMILSSWCFSIVWLRRKKRMLLSRKNYGKC